jgi:hypothetical protein
MAAISMSDDVGVVIGKRPRQMPPECGAALIGQHWRAAFRPLPGTAPIGVLHQQAVRAGLPVVGARRRGAAADGGEGAA